MSLSVPEERSVPLPTKNGRPLRLSRKVRAAIDAMVWQGLKRDDAAEAAGLKDNSLYVALTRPDVKAYYLSQCEVLRVSGRARRIRRLEEMVEQDENKMAVVQAVKALDGITDIEAAAASQQRQPGVVVVVMSPAAAGNVTTPHVIEHSPISGSEEG